MSEDEYLTPRQKRFLADNPEVSVTADNASRPRDRIAGWLGFLVACLLFLGPIFTVVMTAGEISQTETLYPELVGTSVWTDGKFITWSSAAVFCLISVFAGVRLLNKHVPSSVVVAIACLWLAGPILSIATLVTLDRAGADPTAADAGQALGRPLVWAVIWTLYLLISKRVRATYLADQSLRSMIARRWKLVGKRTRQFIFFGLCWVVLSFLYFQLIAPFGRYPAEDEVERMWSVILLPPFLVLSGMWAYGRFVGADD